MKQELLEYLIRTCVREVLNQNVNELDDKNKGAEAPPGGGLGTADQPPLDQDKNTDPSEPSELETPPMHDLKGVLFINPRDKSKIKPVTLVNDANLQRNLQNLAKTVAGPQGFVAKGTLETIQKVLLGQIPTVYLYFGKLASDARDIYLQADVSKQVAKDSSVLPSEITGIPVSSVPTGISSPEEEPQPPQAQPVAEQQLRSLIKKMVNEVLDRK